jgi:hypothetical protein
MNINTIKTFSTMAFDQFTEAVTGRLSVHGIKQDKDEQLVIIDSDIQEDLISKRKELIQLVQEIGFTSLVEYATYTWFNRLCAIRYMELHDYLGHGFRILSHPDNPKGFEILDHVQDIADDFKLDKNKLIELKLAGNKDEELFRELLLGQCHHLKSALPFLFSEKGDVLELLLPDNLTRTDSPVKLMIRDLPDSYWQSLDLFTLIFEFYYSKYKKSLPKKIERSGLPIATQVSEPKWVSQFMVENTLARRWKEINPESKIDEDLVYYLPSAEQSEQVKLDLEKISASSSKSPENLRVLDPACGSGSNLLRAYELLYNIYQEEGYRSKEIPLTMFSNNLVGFDIDDRACQVSNLVLMLRAREDDRRIFTRGISPAIYNLSKAELSSSMQDLTVNSKELGFILTLPDDEQLADTDAIESASIANARNALSIKYDVIVCYPPNLGILRTGETLESLKSVANFTYASTKSNLATMCVERAIKNLKPNGFSAFLLKDSWLFLSRYEKMRSMLFKHNTIECLAHLARGIIPDQHRMNAVVFRHATLPDYEARYCLTELYDLTTDSPDRVDQLPVPCSFPIDNDRLSTNTLSRMGIVPTKPVSYWVDSALQSAFLLGTPFSKTVNTERLGKNVSRDEFVRQWYELEISHYAIESNQDQTAPWSQLVTGGSLRRWYGNLDAFVNTSAVDCNQVQDEANTWTALTTTFNTRVVPEGSYFDASGPCFSQGGDKVTRQFLLGLTNSKVFDALVHVIYPENVLGSMRPKDLANLPIVDTYKTEISENVEQLISLSKEDWHSIETSWGFKNFPLLDKNIDGASNELEVHYQALENKARDFIKRVSELETGVNEYVIQSYKLEEVFSADILNSELAYHNNPYYLNPLETGQSNEEYEQDIWGAYRANKVQALISYGIGCVLGRYHVGKTGVTYAGSAGQDFNEIYDSEKSAYKPDEDGIVPLTDIAWFKDDAAECFRDWLKVTFGVDMLDKNMQFLSESILILLPNSLGEKSPFEILRYYLVVKFYKHHVDSYQKKPIYWLFSSGKQKAFECLVYLHRYNEGTLSRMRTEYVAPLLGKYEAYVVQVQKQLDDATSTSEAKQYEKELEVLLKKQTELGEFDDKLKHYADMQIQLNLDDGVKVNYGKFGDLLADVKAISGKNVSALK